MPAPFTRYLVRFGASLLAVFLAVWAYIAFAPMAFFESGYATWRAKQAMLDECQVGQIAFFGDSRLESGVVPALLPVPAINFGLPAGTAIETHSAARRAAACGGAPPKQAVIALTPGHFGALSRFFWLLSVRYGFIPPGELRETERWADRLDDAETLATPTPDGFSGRLRDVLYAIRFPSLSFSSLVQGQVFGRYRTNAERFQAVIRDRGWTEYSPSGGALVHEMAAPFAPTKLQTAEFEAAVDLLRQRGVEVLLLVVPFAQGNMPDPRSQQAYLGYLREVARRPGVHLVADELPVWPDELFVDGEHLNGTAARAFTTKLAQCTVSGRLQPGCDLRWTAATASQLPSPVLQVQQ